MRLWSTAALVVVLGACSSDYRLAQKDAGASSGGAGGGVVDSGWVDGGGGVAGASGAGGSGGGEQCDNGIDDDGDKLVDCADPDCAASQCVTVPANWSGPVFLATAQSAPLLRVCPGGVPAAVEGGIGTPTKPALGCAPCTCGAPGGATCQIQPAKAYNLGQCADANQVTYTAKANQCTNLPPVFGTELPNSLRAPAIAAVGATCNAAGGTESSRPAPTFNSFGRVCSGTVGGGCAAGEKCSGGPPSGFEPGVCVTRSGDHACPTGFDKTRTVLFDLNKFTDTRACGKCTCGVPSGNYCTGTAQFFLGPNCTNKHATEFTLPTNDCRSGGADWYGIWVTVGKETGGACAAVTGKQTGSVAPTAPTTVCCDK